MDRPNPHLNDPLFGEETLNTSPAVPFEENRTPVLVINQSLDKMVDLQVTRRNYERLAGPKRYLQVPFGHWSSQPAFAAAIARVCDKWFREHEGAGGLHDRRHPPL